MGQAWIVSRAEGMIEPIQVCGGGERGEKGLKSKGGELLEWAKQHKTALMKKKNGEIQFAATLAGKHRSMSTDSAVEKADPLAIAMGCIRSREALAGGWAVAAAEGGADRARFPKF